jgi:protein-S-isoprenylcysteine O-methyltransferase Ste14
MARPSRSSWQFWWTWTLALAIWLGLHVLAILDWNTFAFPSPVRFTAGVFLYLAGTALACWGIREVGLSNSLGLRGGLVTSGPYRRTRNPQYPFPADDATTEHYGEESRADLDEMAGCQLMKS